MRFLCLYKPGTPENDEPPSQEHMAAMGKLMDDMQRAGVLLMAEGCMPTSRGVRVRIDSGRFSVTDGPFADTVERISGLCMMQVKTKDEALEWGKRFLKVVGVGQTELRQMHEFPAT